MTENKLFRDPEVKPDNGILEKTLGKKYLPFAEFSGKIMERNLIPEWHYYNDGKSWLGKVMYKKKNLCWISAWNTGAKLTFYFTGKTLEGFMSLAVDESIKKAAGEAQPAGKLIPVKISLRNRKMISDALKLIDYKMTLK